LKTWVTRHRRNTFAAWRTFLALALLFSSVELIARSGDGKYPALENLASYVLPLKVPVFTYTDGSKQHRIEFCSGTLMATQPPAILTAWHCFDGLRDLTRPPQGFVAGEWISLKLLASGDSMKADWALLIPSDNNNLSLPQGLSIAADMPRVFSVAGYSRKQADQRKVLSIDHDCTVIGQLEGWLTTTCDANEGSSGGPAVAWIDGELKIFGVISARNEAGTLLITPVSTEIYPPGVLPSPP
jgi:hypothetical protein